jgi:hypothetical protein
MRIAMHWLEPSDVPAARAWAEIEILAANVFAELTANGVMNAEGEPRRLLTELRQLRQVQLAYARELGMTPAARMAINANGTRAAVDLAAAMASLTHTDSVESEQSTSKTRRAARDSSNHQLRENSHAVKEKEDAD